MEKYNYFESVKNDVLDFIKFEGIEVSNENRDEVAEDLHDRLFVSDSVTGNASGSYTFNTWQSEENLCHNMDLLVEALREFGCDLSYLEKGAEVCDVTIRCYLLGSAISAALDEILAEE